MAFELLPSSYYFFSTYISDGILDGVGPVVTFPFLLLPPSLSLSAVWIEMSLLSEEIDFNYLSSSDESYTFVFFKFIRDINIISIYLCYNW